MYKNILLAIILIFIAGCSKPKPVQAPSWYTTVPKDDKFLYAVGTSTDKNKAKVLALISMRENLVLKVNKTFENKNHILQPLDKNSLEEIFQHNYKIANKLSFSNTKIIKSAQFKGKELVLISIPKINMFNKLKAISDAKFYRVKQENKKSLNKNVVNRFISLDKVVDSYSTLASLTAYEELLNSKYMAKNEFIFLKNMKNEYNNLKETINIYVLTDGNSRIFASSIKKAIHEKGFSTKNSIKSKNSIKLLITSNTQESQDYSFNQSKSLVKFTTLNKDKDKIAFRQHTFIGKSRRSYIDAKKHSATYLNNKLKRLGIFNFIGFTKE